MAFRTIREASSAGMAGKNDVIYEKTDLKIPLLLPIAVLQDVSHGCVLLLME